MPQYDKATQTAGLVRITKQLESVYGLFIDMKDVKSVGEHRNETLITRCVAAHAVSLYGDEPDPELAANAVCDGKDDGGIDAVYVNKNSKKIVIVQSKYIKNGEGSITTREFGRFKDACVKVIAGDFTTFNERFLKNKDAISEAISGFTYKCICVFIYTGVHQPSDEVKADISFWEQVQNRSLLFKDIQDREEYSVLFEPADIQVIMDGLSTERSGSINVENVHLESYGEIANPYKAIYGTISARLLYEWWRKYKYSLFEKNIRSVLGSSTINTGIKRTLQEQPSNFWYYNNGITAVYSEVEESMVNLSTSRRYGLFSFKNLSIINGAQTVSTIGEVFHSLPEEKKDLIKVNIRFINAAEDDFLTSVTKFNNTQNRVTGRDFSSQRPEQQRIQREINFIGGYSYKLLRQEDSGPTSSNTIDIDDALNALVCSSKDETLLSSLKLNRGRFFESWGGLYEKVFPVENGPTGLEIINKVNAYRMSNDILQESIVRLLSLDKENQKQIHQVMIHGNYVLISILMDRLKIASIENHLISYERNMSLDDCIDMASETYNYIQRRFPTSYIARFFQNREKVLSVISYLLGAEEVSENMG
ncbi:possible abortive infection phage resistance protein, putative [Cronobacter dublinensis 1210]|uniref:Possible abortive infection phage resistance protein, putative n=1 Tax=Cronobacter dublinensis 1210 TaxID=1208656 RepID=A0ABP1W5I5_9ENTR|nr:AIPR family protein [Cronobacter dublinensis]MDI7270291.1 AIPR family protein [Cronobacter dublinensis]CCJ80425.1 possible abortive infection phage resistance protein, putative [Cronobacter dublinensis 1210]